MGRYKSGTFQISKPLSLPTSKRVEACYSVHGKGFAKEPPVGAALDMLVVDPRSLVTRWVPGMYAGLHTWRCPGLADDSTWLFLGWRVLDGSMPLGEYDRVDPEIAQLKYLRPPHSRDQFKIVAGEGGAVIGGRFLPIDQKPPTR